MVFQVYCSRDSLSLFPRTNKQNVHGWHRFKMFDRRFYFIGDEHEVRGIITRSMLKRVV